MNDQPFASKFYGNKPSSAATNPFPGHSLTFPSPDGTIAERHVIGRSDPHIGKFDIKALICPKKLLPVCHKPFGSHCFERGQYVERADFGSKKDMILLIFGAKRKTLDQLSDCHLAVHCVSSMARIFVMLLLL
jgi:hypothetical protein